MRLYSTIYIHANHQRGIIISTLEIYKGKTVFITGHTGFKGTWLSLWLKKLGAKVIGYSNGVPTQPSMYEILKMQDKVYNVISDVRSFASLELAMLATSPDIVFHLAAQPIVKESYRQPKLTFETNVMGTVNVLESIRLVDSVKAAVIITTDKVYKERYPYVYDEWDELGGNDPYSASKACAEFVINSYRQSFLRDKINIASTRAGNIIGGGDFAERIVPVSIKSIINGLKIPVYAPNSVRPWQFVLEPLYGYLLLGAKLLNHEDPAYTNQLCNAFNFGPQLENCIRVETLIEKIIGYWGSGEYSITEPDETAPESTYLRLRSSQAKRYLNWETIYSIDKSIEKTVSWYKNYYSNEIDMYNFTLNQIEDYEKGLKK